MERKFCTMKCYSAAKRQSGVVEVKPPTEAEISERCAEIRETWDDDERAKRGRPEWQRVEYEIPRSRVRANF